MRLGGGSLPWAASCSSSVVKVQGSFHSDPHPLLLSGPPWDPQPLSCCAVSLLCIQLVVTPATSEQFPKREWGHPACNPGFLWEELRFAPALRLPQASANEAVAAGAAARGTLDTWPGLWRWGAGFSLCFLPPPRAGRQVWESEGNRHGVAPEPSRPSHCGRGSGGKQPAH